MWLGVHQFYPVSYCATSSFICYRR